MKNIYTSLSPTQQQQKMSVQQMVAYCTTSSISDDEQYETTYSNNVSRQQFRGTKGKKAEDKKTILAKTQTINDILTNNK